MEVFQTEVLMWCLNFSFEKIFFFFLQVQLAEKALSVTTRNAEYVADGTAKELTLWRQE